MLIEITDHIDLDKASLFLRSPDAGGTALFIGTVRNQAGGRQVLQLEFEAYEPMAILEMKKIAANAHSRWPLTGLVIQHVIGARQVGEAVVVVGASSAHRRAAFDACQFLIDSLKATVPIWKKESYTDGSVWVNAHP